MTIFDFAVALGLEHMRKHRHALVGPGGQRVRISRRNNDNCVAVLQRVQLAHQQLAVCGPAFRACGMISAAASE